MHVVWAILAGLIIGTLAKLLVRGRQNIPIWLTSILGIIGGLIGDFLATKLNVHHTKGIDWIRHLLQIAAAAVLIGIIAPIYGGRSRRGVARY